jgi:integrase/recombinase XerD
MGNPDRVRTIGPLSAFSSGFAAELVRRRYWPNAAANQLQLMAHRSCRLAQRGLTADRADRICAREVSLPRAVTRVIECGCRPRRCDRCELPSRARSGAGGARPVAGRAGTAAGGRYRGYLVRERGLSPATARLYAHLEHGR